MFGQRRWYPGFFGALFLILLRVAIGWHFLYEGIYKWESYKTSKPFSSEGYLRYSVGPFAPLFRGLIPDVDSLRKTQPETIREDWEKLQQNVADHYGFDDQQIAQATQILDEQMEQVVGWFRTPENIALVAEYLDNLEVIREVESDSDSRSYQREYVDKLRIDADTKRRTIVAEFDGWTDDLESRWIDEVANSTQQTEQGAFSEPWTRLALLDNFMVFSLIIFGFGLLVGLLTPLSALGCAGLLTTFYLSQPPFPGLAQSPMSEGHYLFVNKNLVELLACLVLAATPSGLWVGFDALLFGGMRRRDVDRWEAEESDQTTELAGETPESPKSPA